MLRCLMDTLKTLSMMGCSLLFGSGIPEREVPSVIRNSFATEFPEAVAPAWEREQEGFEVEFSLDRAEYSALFNKKGKMVMLKKEVGVTSLPPPVLEKIQTEYSHYSIGDITIIEKDGNAYFQVALEGKFTEKKEVFTHDGHRAGDKYWD